MREAEQRREEAIELGRAIGDRALELRATCELATLRTVTMATYTGEQALELATQAIAELETLGDEHALAAAWFLRMAAENLRASWEDAAAAVEHVVEHARASGERRLESEALEFLGPSIFWGPTPAEIGLPRLEEILESAGSTTSASRRG